MLRNTVAAALLVSVASLAGAEDKAPRPGPEVEKLGFFVGKWKTSGELKQSGKKSYASTWSVMGPDGKWQTVMEATSNRE